MTSRTGAAAQSFQPLVTIVIPAYNQARYLAGAVQSALGQTFRGFEIIVVDDGSTDDTPAVAAAFGSAIQVVRQMNKGLAAARNAGLRRSQAEYIAFLDSDDEWLPQFLERLLALAAQQPEAAACYCGARCIDADGRELPQVAGAQQVAPGALYDTLLRANFLIPSTVLARRPAVVAAGLFDESDRVIDGCADWDLWLRLARTQPFAGTPDSLAHYRLHESSLSTDTSGMRLAAEAVVAKHFGPEEGLPAAWPRDKRRAYGGLHRYNALTAVMRQGDWPACAGHLRRALECDPTLAADRDLFYELALGAQPLGYRGTTHQIDLGHSLACVLHALAEVFRPPLSPQLAATRPTAFGTAYYALGLAAYNTRQFALSRRFLWRAVRHQPGLWRDSQLSANLVKSLLGPSMLDALKGRLSRRTAEVK